MPSHGKGSTAPHTRNDLNPLEPPTDPAQLTDWTQDSVSLDRTADSGRSDHSQSFQFFSNGAIDYDAILAQSEHSCRSSFSVLSVLSNDEKVMATQTGSRSPSLVSKTPRKSPFVTSNTPLSTTRSSLVTSKTPRSTRKDITATVRTARAYANSLVTQAANEEATTPSQRAATGKIPTSSEVAMTARLRDIPASGAEDQTPLSSASTATARGPSLHSVTARARMSQVRTARIHTPRMTTARTQSPQLATACAGSPAVSAARTCITDVSTARPSSPTATASASQERKQINNLQFTEIVQDAVPKDVREVMADTILVAKIVRTENLVLNIGEDTKVGMPIMITDGEEIVPFTDSYFDDTLLSQPSSQVPSPVANGNPQIPNPVANGIVQLVERVWVNGSMVFRIKCLCGEHLERRQLRRGSRVLCEKCWSKSYRFVQRAH